MLPALGYLLALTGFSATVASGWWLAAGFVTICYGYAIGTTGTALVRRRDGLVVGLVLSLLGGTIGATVLGRDFGVQAATVPQPFLEIRIESTKTNPEAHELTVRGIVRNTGPAAVFSPSIELLVHEISTGALVATDTAYPGDMIESWLASGAERPFQHVALIPDDVGPVEWEIVLDDTRGTVVMDTGVAR